MENVYVEFIGFGAVLVMTFVCPSFLFGVGGGGRLESLWVCGARKGKILGSPFRFFLFFEFQKFICLINSSSISLFLVVHNKLALFVWFQVLEKLFRERYTPGRGVGSIILCPTRELACQTFEVFKSVARHHSFSIGLLTGGGNSVDLEKEHGNDINLLVCTPAALFIQMERVNLDCSQLKVFIRFLFLLEILFSSVYKQKILQLIVWFFNYAI